MAIVKEEMMYGNTSNLSTSTAFPALNACRLVGSNPTTGITTQVQAAGQNAENRAWRQQYMYRRDELTNSPYANRTNYPEAGVAETILPTNYYSRDVDGTFMGEWGYIQSYLNSGLTYSNSYWTAEVSSSSFPNDYLFVVHAHGNVDILNPAANRVVICRGE